MVSRAPVACLEDSTASSFISITAGWQETVETTLSLIHKSPEDSKAHFSLFFTIAPTSVCKSFKLLASVSHFIPPNLTPSFPKIHHRHCNVAMFSIQYTVNSSPEAQMRLICALMRPVLLGKPLLCCIIVMTKHLLGR